MNVLKQIGLFRIQHCSCQATSIGLVRRAYVDIGSIDVVRVRDPFLRLQHHPVEVI